MIKIGQSWDCHNLVKGTGFVLGGELIKINKSVKAYSDGDVVYHTVGESIIGALALGDLGDHFNSSNFEKNFSSKKILTFAKQKLEEKKFIVCNIDVLIILDEPKLLNIKKNIKKNLARELNIEELKINIKATTSEGNKKNLVECHSVVLIEG